MPCAFFLRWFCPTVYLASLGVDSALNDQSRNLSPHATLHSFFIKKYIIVSSLMKINMDTPASCIREDTTKCISGQFNNNNSKLL